MKTKFFIIAVFALFSVTFVHAQTTNIELSDVLAIPEVSSTLDNLMQDLAEGKISSFEEAIDKLKEVIRNLTQLTDAEKEDAILHLDRVVANNKDIAQQVTDTKTNDNGNGEAPPPTQADQSAMQFLQFILQMLQQMGGGCKNCK